MMSASGSGLTTGSTLRLRSRTPRRSVRRDVCAASLLKDPAHRACRGRMPLQLQGEVVLEPIGPEYKKRVEVDPETVQQDCLRFRDQRRVDARARDQQIVELDHIKRGVADEGVRVQLELTRDAESNPLGSVARLLVESVLHLPKS